MTASEGSINDVEKRWRDPAAVRAAMKYVGIVIALALVVTALIETAQFCSSKVLTVWLRH